MKGAQGGTWPWQARSQWWRRQDHKRARRAEFEDAAQQWEDSMDDLDEEAQRNREQDHADILAMGYVLNEDGVYVRPHDTET